MSFEICYKYHPRKEDLSYDKDKVEEKSVKVGKPFDDTPPEKCAAAIMAQLARRDVWVIDVQVFELVKKEISFKEATDGKGILLKNKKYSLSSTSEVLAEDLVEVEQSTAQPHEMNQQTQNLTNLYAGAPTPVRKNYPQYNQKTVIYQVVFEPNVRDAHMTKGMKFSENKRYPVHAVVPSPNGKLEQQKIAVTDDTGAVVVVSDAFFNAAGSGLYADELGFSGTSKKSSQLAHEHDYVEDTLGSLR